MKKRVIRSPLDLLPLHQVQQLRAWLTTGGPHGFGIPYAEVKERMFREFGVKTSVTALCDFYHRQNHSNGPRIEHSYDPTTGALTLIIQTQR